MIELALILALVVLQLGDWWTTRTILSQGGRELNPIAEWGMGKLGIDGFLAAKVVWVGVIACGLPWWLNAPLALFYAGVVGRNFKQIRK